eukprot:Trichotokara_eunicae@DN5140_c0_g1_i2.p1
MDRSVSFSSLPALSPSLPASPLYSSEPNQQRISPVGALGPAILQKFTGYHFQFCSAFCSRQVTLNSLTSRTSLPPAAADLLANFNHGDKVVAGRSRLWWLVTTSSKL